MIGGIYFAGAPFAGVLKAAGAAAVLSASVSVSFTSSATIEGPPAYFAGSAAIAVSSSGTIQEGPAYLEGSGSIVWSVGSAGLIVPIDTGIRIEIGGVPVTARVRVQGVTIHDILNDAPNTATFTIEGEAPAVGQPVRILLGNDLYFAGVVQTVDAAYESKPIHRVWHLTAIDDTAAANYRRPFGTWFETSATTIALEMTETFAPGFSTAGIEAGLPPVTIVFDGADTLIACLARLATAVGGYCKVEDRTVYLFTEDLSDPPDPLDQAHRFLTNPPIQMNTDASQLRTRVYGKGYGEHVTADLLAGAPMWPIQDGAQFPALGGSLIAGLTADGAQSEKVTFAGTVLASAGSLVGTGSSPTNAPVVQLQGGEGVTPGLHTVSVAYRTAAGQSLAGPPATITSGVHAPPGGAPLAGAAVTGTGPDQGSHDYAASFVTAYGETLAGPVSNAVTTSAASGQLPAPGNLWAGEGQQGAGADDGTHVYVVTFTNPQGETTPGSQNGIVVGPKLVGQTDPVSPGGVSGTMFGTTGGSLTPGKTYVYSQTYTTASGETTRDGGLMCTLTSTENAANVTIARSPDPRVTGRKLYRYRLETISDPPRLCATIPNNVADKHFDTVSDASIAGNPEAPATDSTANPGTLVPFNQIPLSGIPTGPGTTTGRRIYRQWEFVGPFRLVTSIPDNTTTTFLDTRPNSSLGANAPDSNTTGTAVQRVPVSNIPIGPASVTGRKLYRRFNGAGTFKLVTTLSNNSTTTFNDGVANAALGADALGVATAIGNQIAIKLPIGASAVTARELYFSPVGGSPRRLLWTYPENTTIDSVIQTPDSALTGALEPGADTSGLQQPHGQVNPGAAVLPVASAAPFRPGGGWVVLGGGQVVFHSAISGNTLTGIPPTGSGAIHTAVIYGSQALPSPMLVGVSGLTRPMLKGSGVHIWIQRDDIQAQAEQAARTGGDGVVEFLIVDERRGVESLTARVDADLALFSRPIVTVAYATRDLKTRSGKAIVINLPSQGIVQTLTIQDVTITELDIAKGLAPRFTVKASSVRFTLEDTLRRLMQVGPVSVNT